MATPAKYATPAMQSSMKLGVASGVLRAANKQQPDRSGKHRHPLPQYLLHKSLFTEYDYSKSRSARYGEGLAMGTLYHQYYNHAKCANDEGQPGRDFEFLRTRRGTMLKKALPAPQYVPKDPASLTPFDKNAKPDPKNAKDAPKVKWNWKSWEDNFEPLTMWQREVQYENHVPTHTGAKRPLSVLAPSTYHRHMTLQHIHHIAITVCPFMFGYGQTLQKSVLDFYRRCLSGRSTIPNEKVSLHYAVDFVTPNITVTWADKTSWSPPLFDSIKSQDIIQMVMERAWLETDRMDAAGVKLAPITVDDFKWQQVIEYKKKKEKDQKGSKKK